MPCVCNGTNDTYMHYMDFMLTDFLTCQTITFVVLDASKAFDGVEYCKLFSVSRSRKICNVLLRLLMNIYINLTMQVKCANVMSENSKPNGGYIHMSYMYLVYM